MNDCIQSRPNDTEPTMKTESDKLRAKARDLRQAAMHAERREDARLELNQAAQLEAQADRLDGVVRAPKGKPLTQQQVEENHRAVMAKGRAALEQFFSRNKA